MEGKHCINMYGNLYSTCMHTIMPTKIKVCNCPGTAEGWKNTEDTEKESIHSHVCSHVARWAMAVCIVTSSVNSQHGRPAAAARYLSFHSCCCSSSRTTTASRQSEPSPHTSLQVWPQSWVLDTDLTRGLSLGWLVTWLGDGFHRLTGCCPERGWGHHWEADPNRPLGNIYAEYNFSLSAPSASVD